MVKYLFCCLLFPGFTANAQQKDSSTIYYDKEWRILVDNGDDVFYIRKAMKKDSLWYANDYFADGNKLQMSGSYKYDLDSVKEGNFIWYYKNGKKSQESFYKNGKEEGDWIEWHENGTIAAEGKNVNGQKEGIWKSYYDNGNKETIGTYREGYRINNYESWYLNGNKYSVQFYESDILKVKSSEIKDSTGKPQRIIGLNKGENTFYHENGKVAAVEVWNDTLNSLKYWDENGNVLPVQRDKEGKLVTEQISEFNGGTQALMKFLSKNIKYPNKARKQNAQGRTVLRFVVDKNGDIDDAYVLRSSGFPLLDEEALRVVNTMSGKWNPGKQHNIRVKTYYTLPITFKLNN